MKPIAILVLLIAAQSYANAQLNPRIILVEDTVVSQDRYIRIISTPDSVFDQPTRSIRQKSDSFYQASTFNNQVYCVDRKVLTFQEFKVPSSNSYSLSGIEINGDRISRTIVLEPLTTDSPSFAGPKFNLPKFYGFREPYFYDLSRSSHPSNKIKLLVKEDDLFYRFSLNLGNENRYDVRDEWRLDHVFPYAGLDEFFLFVFYTTRQYELKEFLITESGEVHRLFWDDVESTGIRIELSQYLIVYDSLDRRYFYVDKQFYHPAHGLASVIRTQMRPIEELLVQE